MPRAVVGCVVVAIGGDGFGECNLGSGVDVVDSGEEEEKTRETNA